MCIARMLKKARKNKRFIRTVLLLAVDCDWVDV
jgi:hypothetical protein